MLVRSNHSFLDTIVPALRYIVGHQYIDYNDIDTLFCVSRAHTHAWIYWMTVLLQDTYFRISINLSMVYIHLQLVCESLSPSLFLFPLIYIFYFKRVCPCMFLYAYVYMHIKTYYYWMMMHICIWLICFNEKFILQLVAKVSIINRMLVIRFIQIYYINFFKYGSKIVCEKRSLMYPIPYIL